MATSAATIAFLLEQAAGAVTARKMFGEYALYCDGRVVGLVCDDVLFVKPVGAAPPAMEMCPPYKGAKPHWRIPPDAWEDGTTLAALLRRVAAALPPPKPKRNTSR